MAAKEITNRLFERYRDTHGDVSYPDVFNALGALAGFGCQMALREGFVKKGLVPEDKAFVVVATRDGARYYFGPLLNNCLASQNKDQVSVWSMTAGAAQMSGKHDLPDIKNIAENSARNVGGERFGVPRIPEPYRIREMPTDVVKRDWASMRDLLVANKVDPILWGLSFAFSAQNLIFEQKDRFDAGVAAKIVMEAAWPMSKIDPIVLNDNRLGR
jgi:hypothetical protein